MRDSLLGIIAVLLIGGESVAQAPGRAVLEPLASAQFRFGGPVGRRVAANGKGWLVRAPAANPGMLGMFRLRDRLPRPNLVPWAGEFVGKYLISAIQALRMSDDPDLEKTVRAVVDELLACQAEDGYLGPFPRDIRLVANWDLWGHYHAMLALLMWHERTGDARALAACCKAADLVSKTFPEAGRRFLSAGSDEMNLAMIHSLGWLYRKTGQARYLGMMREIEKDWEKAGDYFRAGLAGTEYFRIPRPRWESLHDLQGLVELYLITGDDRYRRSFLHHWQSIRRWDRHNNGAFSSGEQATGNPYQPNAIETCCTVAWMAITLDALRLTGDPVAADELELSTYNGMIGAQHPSGSWCTYNTPMDGHREASHHTIVFQSRAGTPDLNCCSVNGPRGLGMLSEWAVMRSERGIAVNYYGPMQAQGKLADGAAVRLEQETDYPRDGRVRIKLCLEKPAEFDLALRIPAWSRQTKLAGPDAAPVAAPPGRYVALRRVWKPGDTVTLEFDMRLRYESGDLEAFGKMSIYRGPILLAYDQRLNDFDEAALPAVEPAMLSSASVTLPEPEPASERFGRFSPWVIVEIPAATAGAQPAAKPTPPRVRLCDFATAGATGSRYVSWLPGRNLVPPPPVPHLPADGSSVPSGTMVFTWRRPAAADASRTHTVVIAESPDFHAAILEIAAKPGWRVVVPAEQAARLKPNVEYFWKLVARNPAGATECLAPAKRFRIDPSLRPLTAEDLSEYGEGPDGTIVTADLAGDPKPAFGKLIRAQGWQPAAGIDGKPNGAVALDGKTGMLVYALRAFPSYEYTVALWFAHEHKEDRLGQVYSAWDHAMDDPLRLCVVGGKLFARVEAGGGYSTEGVPVAPGDWHHVAAVKSGTQLTLYLDGKRAAAMTLPMEVCSSSRAFALGGNPLYTGQSEHLPCRVARLVVSCRAMSAEEVARLFSAQSAGRAP
ncbi:MAG: glycoside hydrolase family 127 protein [Thermoguttaceae bacterium]|jgi:DUF1680 family protein|nr:glycoside hydrolase family 127 protein [Thermoguttaceae bacterium]